MTRHIRRRVRFLLWSIVGIGAGALFVLIMWLITTNAVTSQANNETLDIIKDCTTPGRKCYDRGQKRTADVVFNLNRVTIYAAACATKEKNQGNIAKIQACVLHRIEQDQHNDKLRESVPQ